LKLPCLQLDSKFMKLAAKEASKGMQKGKGGPFGALIVKDGVVISKASNEVLQTNDPTMHAEINAIRKASKKLATFDLSGCVLYSSCMPCPMCLAAIKWANIKTVYYGATAKDADAIGFRDEIFYGELNIEKIKNLELIECERDVCLKPFAEWSAKNDRIMY
jgi:guanine deaminase